MFTASATSAQRITVPTPSVGPNTGPAAAVNNESGKPKAGSTAIAMKKGQAPASRQRMTDCRVKSLTSARYTNATAKAATATTNKTAITQRARPDGIMPLGATEDRPSDSK